MNKIDYTLGLDLGIASVGWSVIGLDENENPSHIVDTGVIVVEGMEDKSGNLENTKRRDSRGSRRTLRRRQMRIKRIKGLLKRELGIASIDSCYNVINDNIYELKVKGLYNKLSKEELTVCLLHYAKHRGFKSNRKDETLENDGDVLKALKSNEERLGNKYISELILDEIDKKTKVKNSGNYKYTFRRKDFEEEIVSFLNCQIKNNVIGEDFKEQYLEIWNSQRDFSEGPDAAHGEQTNYKVDFAKVFGYCTFDKGELRAPRFSPSQEINMLIGKLQNIRYNIVGNEDVKYNGRIDSKNIKDFVNELIQKKTITYSTVSNMINKKETHQFKGLRISKKRYAELKTKYPELSNNDFNVKLIAEMNKENFAKIVGTTAIRDKFVKAGLSDLFEELLKNNISLLDDIARGLTFYKTESRIKQYFEGIRTEEVDFVSDQDWSQYPEVIEHVIPSLSADPFKESASLSLNLLHKLNSKMLNGEEYSEVMKEFEYNHSIKTREGQTNYKLPQMKHILDKYYKNEINNPRVIRVLAKTGSLINSCIDAYGSPKYINIEVARDINLKSGKRAILLNEQLTNLDKNEEIKAKIVSKGLRSYSNITKYDIEKYKLHEQQKGKCMYSLKTISESDILTNATEIDHIIPYSKSKMNSLGNKTLVYREENHKKTDTVPLQYLAAKGPDFIEEYKKFVNELELENNITAKKASMYLASSLSDIPEEFGDAAINDTRYITKYLVDILTNNLQFADGEQEKKVRSFKAGYVNTYKKMLGLTNLTHSLQSPNYINKQELLIKEVLIDQKKKSIKIVVYDRNSEKQYESSVSYVKKDDSKLNKYERQLNFYIDNVTDNIDCINIDNEILEQYKFHEIIDKNLLIGDCNLSNDKIEELTSNLTFILTKIKAEIDKQSIKKNRDNHLHHALDATVVGLIDYKKENLLSKYEKQKQEFLEKLKNKEKLAQPITVNIRGERKEIVTAEEYNVYENAILRNVVEPPFENLTTEVKAFIYERDPEIQQKMINDNKIRNLRPLIPVQTKKRRYKYENGKLKVGNLHLEGVYGKSGNVTTTRIDTLDLDAKKVEKIVGKESYAKPTYKACKEWFENGKPTKYPILGKNRDIKKVTIEKGDATKAIKLNRGYVAVDEVVRIDVFKDGTSDKLYFLQQTAMTLIQNEEGKEFNQQLWYGQGDKVLQLTNKDIKDNYVQICSLHPGDLIELEKTNGEKGICYVVGFSSGMFEIRDIIGDNYYLNMQYNIKIDRAQTFLTASTIKSIQKKKINIRGEIKN